MVPQDIHATTNKKFVVIDIGCHECGVGSEFYGVYRSLKDAEDAEDAEDAVDRCNKETGGWRNGGQTMAEYFEIEV